MTIHVSLCIPGSNLKMHSIAALLMGLLIEVTSLLLSYLPQPFAHDCLKELPGRDLTQDFPITVCEDGISMAS